MDDLHLKEKYENWLGDQYMDTISSAYMRLLDAADSVSMANHLSEISIFEIPLPEFYTPLSVDIMNLLSDTQITDENYLRINESLSKYGDFLNLNLKDISVEDAQEMRSLLKALEKKKLEREAAEEARKEQEKQAMLDLFSEFATEIDEDEQDDLASEDDDDLAVEALFDSFAHEIPEPHGWPLVPFKTTKKTDPEPHGWPLVEFKTTETAEYESEKEPEAAAQTEEPQSEAAADTDETNAPEEPKKEPHGWPLIPFETKEALDAPGEQKQLEGSSTIELPGAIEMGGTIELDGTVSSMVLEDSRDGQKSLHAPEISGLLVNETAIPLGGVIEMNGIIELAGETASEDPQEAEQAEMLLREVIVTNLPEPAGFKLGHRETIPVDSWTEMYVRVLDELIPLNREKIGSLTEFSSGGGAMQDPKLLSNGRIIEGRISPEQILRNLAAVLNLCLLSPDSLRLFFPKKDDES